VLWCAYVLTSSLGSLRKFSASNVAASDPDSPKAQRQADAEEVSTADAKRKIVFDTTNSSYFNTLRDLLKRYDFEVRLCLNLSLLSMRY
jgi:hypothetical protein